MATCTGTVTNWQGSHSCQAMLYRCEKCGNVGCEQQGGEPSKGGIVCSNQAFKNGYCLRCNGLQTMKVFQ